MEYFAKVMGILEVASQPSKVRSSELLNFICGCTSEILK